MSEKLDGRIAADLEKYRAEFAKFKDQREALIKKRGEIDRGLTEIGTNLHRLDAAMFALSELQKEQEKTDEPDGAEPEID
jgi:hypothetical protein